MNTLRKVTRIRETLFGGVVETQLNRFVGGMEATAKAARELAKRESRANPNSDRALYKFEISTWNNDRQQWIHNETWINGYN